MKATLKKYIDLFKSTQYGIDMQNTKENSPYHREDSVWVHTMMMLDVLNKEYAHDLSDKEYVMVALSILFHDVGKPIVKTEKIGETRGKYLSFNQHESHSARVFESIAMKSYVSYEKDQNIKHLFGLTNDDIYWITWMIENHLYYKRAKHIASTLVSHSDILKLYKVFISCDTKGRISDTLDTDLIKLEETLLEFDTFTCNFVDKTNQPKCYILIGAPGSGKSTYSKTYLADTVKYSWDDLRVDFYKANEKVSSKVLADEKLLYDKAHEYAKSHSSEFMRFTSATFDALLNTQKDIIVDNTNTIKKNRNGLIQSAKHKGYKVIAVYFLMSIDILYARNKTRPDKYLSDKVIDKLYYNTTMPTLDEVDEIRWV